jgi:hypothetical protein
MRKLTATVKKKAAIFSCLEKNNTEFEVQNESLIPVILWFHV